MSSRARKRHQRSNGSVLKKILLGLGVVLVVIGIAAGAAAGWVYDMWDDAGTIDDQKVVGEEGANSKVYAADGSLLGIIDANIIREPVGLRAIPKTLQQATIAIEDENFYEHDGVDFSAIIRATVENVEAGEIEQGASTITQQLVRNLYIKKPDDTLERKLTEAKWSMEFEEDYTKDEILEKYLNTATYGTNSGDTAVGVEAASQIYFNKNVDEINLGEAALLAGLPQAPSQYNPFTSADAAIKRRNLVLDAMLEQGYIGQNEHKKWSEAGLGLERGLRYDQFRYRYFFDYVQQELIERYGTATARVGGLEVYTTLDPKLQETAEGAIAANYCRPGLRRHWFRLTPRPVRSRQWPPLPTTTTRSTTWPPRDAASPARRTRPSHLPPRSSRESTPTPPPIPRRGPSPSRPARAVRRGRSAVAAAAR